MTVVLCICAISIFDTSVSRSFFFHFLTSYLTILLSLAYLLLFIGDGLFIRMILDFILSLQAFQTSSGRPLTCFVLLISTTSSVILLVVSLNFVHRLSTYVSSSCRRGSKAPPIFALNSSAMLELLSRLTSELFGRLFSRLVLVPCSLTFASTRLRSDPMSAEQYDLQFWKVLKLSSWVIM